MSSNTFDLPYGDIVDFHSHILPGVDHGSDNLKTSLSQLEIAKKHSVKRILSTSHFYPNEHTLESFLVLRNNAALELKNNAFEGMPVVKLGAEVLICDGLERFPGLEKLCFSGTSYIMLELPTYEFSEEYAITAGYIADMGYKVILAHADRYPEYAVEVMLDYGVSSLQINTYSISSLFRKKRIFDWIERGLVSSIGSDIHGAKNFAYRKFVSAQKRLGSLLAPIKKASDKIWNEITAIN